MSKILDGINYPIDLKNLDEQNLKVLAEEIRDVLIERLSITGGHIGPNLGIVEATIAIHYVFNTPKDKVIYDVSHQSYTHKILTGRKEGYINKEKYDLVSGYTDPYESEYDMFKVGHTSTSVSLAYGVAKARDLKKENYNVIAVIGDGSLSGGEAYEGLNNAATLNSNIIILVNDNEMSISNNYGGLYSNLELLRKTKGKAELNFFKSLGFNYKYLEEGNDIGKLIEILKDIKDINIPTVVHIHTTKGKGFTFAEQDKEKWHFNQPFDVKTGNNLNPKSTHTYTTIIKEHLLRKIKEDDKVVVVTAGTPGVSGLDKEFRKEAKEQFVDVGIAEEHAVASVSAMAKAGAKPVFCVHSSFVQRTYDQLSQDLCINNNPALILVYNMGISSANVTHVGAFDIPLISNIPNMVYLAPVNEEEHLAMIDWALEQKEYPVAIRVSKSLPIHSDYEVDTDYSNLNKYKIITKGNTVAIIAIGNFYELGKSVMEQLKQITGLEGTLINPRYLTGVDKEKLELLKEEHSLVVTLEDGVLDGGFGEKISRYYSDSLMKVLNFGGRKEFIDRVQMKELNERYHLTKELIVQDVLSVLTGNKK